MPIIPLTRPTGSVLAAGLVCAAAIAIVLGPLDGWDYYRTPLATRGYHSAHALLRPSGTVGLPLGVAGAAVMLCTLPYALRKRWRRLARLGAMPAWLNVHIFFGMVGPVLISLHTSFKFNGVISVGYWLMAAVWASGFVGRYLYIRIPRNLRGAEQTREALEAELSATADRLAATPLPGATRAAIDRFLASARPAEGRVPGLLDLFFGEARLRLHLLFARVRVRAAGPDLAAAHAAISVAVEHTLLRRRIAHLNRTRRLFALWHLFHQPLVVVMFAIVALHVGVAAYLGYARLAAQLRP